MAWVYKLTGWTATGGPITQWEQDFEGSSHKNLPNSWAQEELLNFVKYVLQTKPQWYRTDSNISQEMWPITINSSSSIIVIIIIIPYDLLQFSSFSFSSLPKLLNFSSSWAWMWLQSNEKSHNHQGPCNIYTPTFSFSFNM